ncbi:response regulator [Dyadobacter subterraneus]|uniref:Response regulator n=1 Tax=Dyadobacter subterraneus TaxID=2773304 RepID=A0ABR9WET3_9BACT|nr:response regulator [Dyadobacter subterraneus]MBE9464007.1 response regulator [Dyadobacter subterraneus]
MNRAKTILIADDDEDDRMLLSEAIRGIISGIVIKEVCDGEALIDQIRLEGPESEIVILLDMNMPRMNGLEALEIIKSDPDLIHIPIIMISTSSNPELITNAYLRGINAYIAKPYLINEYEELARAINVCFLHDYPSFDQAATIKNVSTKSILVIDDNTDESKLINLALKHSLPNVDIIHMNDHATSIEFIASQWDKCVATPQLILLDLYLPDRKSGLDLLEMIKQFLVSKNLSTIPIIMLSQSDDPLDIQDCYRLQANAYMTKSSDLTVWFAFFSYLCHFWMDTIITQSKLSRY